jgi:hypothetical protein
MATKLVIPVVSANSLTLGSESYFMAIAPVSRIPFDKLPLDANLRRANAKSKTVLSMVDTLLKKPQDFLKSNLGIVLIAENAYFKYNPAGEAIALTVEMLSGLHGVANGGHTLSAIYRAHQERADLSEAYVVVRVNVGVKDEAIRNAVVHLNTSEKVDRRSVLHKYGMLDNLKAALDELGYKSINYYQNQAKAEGRRDDTRQNIIHVIKLLILIDNKRWDASQNQHPTAVGIGGSGTLNVSAIERAEDLVLDFVPTLVQVEKAICQKVAGSPRKLPGVKEAGSIEHHSLMVDGTSIPYRIPSVFALPVIAALRALIEGDRWKVPIDEVLQEVVDLLWKEYSSWLRKEWDKDNRSISGLLRNSSIWVQLYNIAKDYYIRYLEGAVTRSADLNGRIPSQVRERSKS